VPTTIAELTQQLRTYPDAWCVPCTQCQWVHTMVVVWGKLNARYAPVSPLKLGCGLPDNTGEQPHQLAAAWVCRHPRSFTEVHV
jgi:hypothetical protein